MDPNEKLQNGEVQFRQFTDKFNALFDSIPDTIALISPEFKILWANESATNRLNSFPNGAKSFVCHNLWEESSASCDSCPVAECFRTGFPTAKTITTNDGKVIELRTIPLKENDRILNVIEVGRDITEHRKLEAQFLHAQKMESIGIFAGGIAHDFNNILTAILGYGQLALTQAAAGTQTHYCIEQILTAAHRASNLTKDLLMFSRKQPSEHQVIDINAIIDKLEPFLKCILYENITYKPVLKEGQLPVRANSHQIEQILVNLSTNARDAMPDGGTLTISTKTATMGDDHIKVYGYGKPGDYAILEISDSGTGMDEETRQRIFEPFFTTKDAGKGTGLGLAVVYAIIKEHNGFIDVCSQPSMGTTFTIYLPHYESSLIEDRTMRMASAIARGTETILLAEDNDLARNMSETVLKEAGYRVISAVDGEDAIRKFTEQGEDVDLLIFDLIMPNMNGIDAFNEIRKIRPDVKIIFASGYAHAIGQQKTLHVDERPFLFKPTTPEELLRKVRSVFDGTVS